jgi:AcrR family transcriptional regulator
VVKARDRVLDASVRLFNKKGTKAVTTNHIAEAAGMSPGNLYYHFRNKEEIIRAIFQGMVERMEVGAAHGQGGYVRPSLEHLEGLFRELFSLHWDYRFFFLELGPLLSRDARLRVMFQGLQRRRLGEISASIRDFIEKGIARPMDPDTVEFLATGIWMISAFWHSFLSAGGGRVTPGQSARGVWLMRNLLRPYLKESALREAGWK